jgi:hypothetical protein
VFGSINTPPPPSSSATSSAAEVDKVFKSLAIGLDPTGTVTPPKHHRKPAKPSDHHQQNKVAVNGDAEDKQVAVDPALQKTAAMGGEKQWKFGNEGLLDSVDPCAFYLLLLSPF